MAENPNPKATVHIGTSCLSKDLVWCECGRGLSLTGKWIYCPNCGAEIDQFETEGITVGDSASVRRSQANGEFWGAIEAVNAALSHEAVAGEASFQDRVHPWILACFGEAIAGDRTERNHRFIEESLELVQSLGATKEECLQLVEYVFGRKIGEPLQEVGGVMVTLAALCLANGIFDMHLCGEAELRRIWTKVDEIRAKQASKPRGSVLPIAVAGEVERQKDAPIRKALNTAIEMLSNSALAGCVCRPTGMCSLHAFIATAREALKPRQRVTFAIPEDLAASLEANCASTGQTKSEVAESAIAMTEGK